MPGGSAWHPGVLTIHSSGLSGLAMGPELGILVGIFVAAGAAAAVAIVLRARMPRWGLRGQSASLAIG
jgi:hypothetical protein